MCIVIAEAGENHCGEMSLAEGLIDISAIAGVDYVKFQLYDASKTRKDDPERKWFFKVQLDKDKLAHLAKYALAKGIKPLCTPWDKSNAKTIFETGISDMKIASFHICDLEMISYVSTRAQRVFLSTGMATYEEIDEAVSILKDVPELYLLHCVSEYPLSYENVNLRVIAALKNRYGDVARIGFSDHTIGILAPVAAAAFGAEVIEKHITLDKNLEGTDHILSADPCELIEMLRQIRAVEKILGSGRKVLTDVEKSHKEFLRHRFSHKEAYSREASYDFGINTRARRV